MNLQDEIRKIEESIRQLQTARESGALSPEVAEASIRALEAQKATYQAQLTGGGGIAQGPGAKAVGAGGVLIEGNVYLGEKPQDTARALEIYRRMMMQTTANLPLRGIDIGASDPSAGQRPLRLANVYIHLDTTTLVPKEIIERKSQKDFIGRAEKEQPLSALDAVIENRALVLLGDPGSGKSTFVNFLAYCLAAHAIEPEAGWLKHLPGWPQKEAMLLPLIVTLRDFSRAYAANLPPKAEVIHLWEFIEGRLREQKIEFAAGPLQQALENGGVLVLFDGLDEVPTQAQRLFVRDAVRAFLQRYPQNRFLVTCRILSYQQSAKGKPDLRLNELPSFTLAPFDNKKISRFIEAWYVELSQQGVIQDNERQGYIQRLGEAITRPDLLRLARNPLLLTVMALVHTHKGRLPDARALLYEETVDMLLWRWEQRKLGGQKDEPPLRQYLLEAGRTDVDLKRTLWELAYKAHAASKPNPDGETLADIQEHDLEIALAALKTLPEGDDDRNWAMKIVETIKVRSGLLLERLPGVFTFPHRTFQEYMAGAYLAGRSDFASFACHLAKDTLWREVVLYAVGKLVYVHGEMDKPLALISELCPARAQTDDTSWRLAWLAGDCLLEVGLKRVSDTQTGRDLLERVQVRLKDLLETGALAATERARAGDTLAALGDPRFKEYCFHSPLPSGEGAGVRVILPATPTLGFLCIPKGKFLMGSSEQDEDAYGDEKPQHELDLPYDYWIAKYPVTVAQWRAFVEASGYRDFAQGALHDPDNRPVRWLTWHDALAYCNWLDGVLKAQASKIEPQDEAARAFWGALASGKYRVTLPSEAEWEKAARGPIYIQQSKINNRIYPWDDTFDPNKANTAKTGLGTTTAVGAFPLGLSPYGCLDMSGNVWEWTRTIGNDKFGYPYKLDDGREDLQQKDALRVLRGGSYIDLADRARCAFCGRFNPDFRDLNYGFRVVVSPFFSL